MLHDSSQTGHHDFHHDLAESHFDLASVVPLAAILKHTLPTVCGITDLGSDLVRQKAGSDYLLELRSESFVHLEVKTRKEDIPRMPLEIWSVWREETTPRAYDPWASTVPPRAVLGWAIKPMLAEFLLINSIPRRLSWLVKMADLQTVLRLNYHKWMERAADINHAYGYYFASTHTDNYKYHTWNLCVPEAHWERAMPWFQKVKWDDLPVAHHLNPC